MSARLLLHTRNKVRLSNFLSIQKPFSTSPTKHIFASPTTKCTFKTHSTKISDILKRYYTKMPKTPDLIYIPHIARWLKTKIQFKILQRKWDPEFTEGAFIYGSSKAICKITEIIYDNKPEQLDGLLTTSAKIKLKDDMVRKLTQTQRMIIKINPEDIKIQVPMMVTLQNNGFQKTCRVTMRILALKWFPQPNSSLKLVLVALQTEFLRDYTQFPISDWTISAFDVLECSVLAPTPHHH